jgi:hypothetical protein
MHAVSGPLPPPEWVERFVRVYPDVAKDIFEEFKKVGETNRKIVLLAQWQGFIALIIIFILTFFCIIYKQAPIGIALVGIGTASMLGILMNKDKENK